jgi:hypothetical protein
VSVESARWRRVEALCQAALDLPAEQRTAFLFDACADDADLRREAQALLSRDADSRRFLETSIGGVAAQVMQTTASSFSGSRLGPFEIGPLIGAGGMGEVYRAHDANLHRDVALKILPELFAVDPERLARFKREAQVLASLNHPNIAAIYGIEAWQPSPGRQGGERADRFRRRMANRAAGRRGTRGRSRTRHHPP